jgi:hypothetical protein
MPIWKCKLWKACLAVELTRYVQTDEERQHLADGKKARRDEKLWGKTRRWPWNNGAGRREGRGREWKRGATHRGSPSPLTPATDQTPLKANAAYELPAVRD